MSDTLAVIVKVPSTIFLFRSLIVRTAPSRFEFRHRTGIFLGAPSMIALTIPNLPLKQSYGQADTHAPQLMQRSVSTLITFPFRSIENVGHISAA